ncbi:MAG: hypothetical protein ACE367_25515 [Acidimicrobiales bacterium]
MDYTAADVASLGRKLDGLELTDAESAALMAVFDAAVDDEVTGFGFAGQQRSPFSARIGSILYFDEADAMFGKRTDITGFIGETEKNLHR